MRSTSVFSSHVVLLPLLVVVEAGLASAASVPPRMELRTELEFCWPQAVADEAAAVHEAVALAHVLILIYVQAWWNICEQRVSFVILI